MTLRSGFERTTDMRLRASGVAYANEDIKIPYILACNYNPDFHLLKSDIFIETKGRLLIDDRRKHIAIRDQHPNLNIRFVFMQPGTKVEGAQMTNERWASKNGFKFAVGEIPQEWLDE